MRLSFAGLRDDGNQPYMSQIRAVLVGYSVFLLWDLNFMKGVARSRTEQVSFYFPTFPFDTIVHGYDLFCTKAPPGHSPLRLVPNRFRPHSMQFALCHHGVLFL